jgi:hypothetical protein
MLAEQPMPRASVGAKRGGTLQQHRAARGCRCRASAPLFSGLFLTPQGLFSNRPKTQRPPAPIADEKRNRMANEGEAATERWHQSIP